MDDQEYGRLDDKIIAAEERGRLRLDTAMARIDGKFDLITATLTHIREDNQQLRHDSQELRTEMRSEFRAVREEMRAMREETRLVREEMRADIKYGYAITRSWGQWLIGTVLLVALTLAGLAVSLKQVWIGGFSSGQMYQDSAHTAGAAPTKP